MTQRTEAKITELVETVINGNKIADYKHYRNMLNSISTEDLDDYVVTFGFECILDAGTKTQKIQAIADMH